MRDMIVIRISSRAAIAAVLTLALLWLATAFTTIVVVLFLAILLAVAVAPLATRLHRRGIPRGIAILLVYLAVVIVLIGAIALLIPLIVSEVNQLAVALPEYARRLHKWLLPFAVPNPLTSDAFTSRASGILLRATSIALRTGEVLLTVIVTAVTSYFLAVDAGMSERMVRRFVPVRYRARVLTIGHVIAVRLGEWLRAQLLIAFFFGAAMTVGMLVMGLPYAMSIGLLGGIIEVIPYVGGLVTVTLASLVALTVNPWLVPVVIAWYLIVTNIEAHVLTPAIMERMIGLQPVLVIIAVFIGGTVYGLLGALLAVPVVVIIQVLLDELYVTEPSPQAEVHQPQQAEQRRTRRIAASIVRGTITHGRRQPQSREPT
ncbi:MAG TPA: AI-2E family transporter [Nitrolancea sp.]|nr:AI-2E family transporter [Nitrolancea sp.]